MENSTTFLIPQKHTNMKKALLSIAALLITLMSFAQGETYVNGYYRSNGTYVEGHYRTLPNYTRDDNWSTIGNVNPYTGVEGTKPGGLNSSYYNSSSYSSYSYPSTSSYNTYSTPSYSTYSTYTPSYDNSSYYNTYAPSYYDNSSYYSSYYSR